MGYFMKTVFKRVILPVILNLWFYLLIIYINLKHIKIYMHINTHMNIRAHTQTHIHTYIAVHPWARVFILLLT